MEVVIVDDAAQAGRLGADVIVAQLANEPRSIIGLATGSSPLPIYEVLVERFDAGHVTFADAEFFLLDEYLGLAPDHPSYAGSIRTAFCRHVDVQDQYIHAPNGVAADPTKEAARYDQAIRDAGGIDVQILGLGTDGHVGFNEPGSSLGSRTRPKTLTDQTRRDNARFFDAASDVPHHVITQGVGTILEAGHLLLVAFGQAKATAVAAAVEGPVTAMCPASALQLHPHVTVLVDRFAASELALSRYYLETYASKPAWQAL